MELAFSREILVKLHPWINMFLEFWFPGLLIDSQYAWKTLRWKFYLVIIPYHKLNCLCAVYYLHHLPIADGRVRAIFSHDHIELISAVFYLLILLYCMHANRNPEHKWKLRRMDPLPPNQEKERETGETVGYDKLAVMGKVAASLSE